MNSTIERRFQRVQGDTKAHLAQRMAEREQLIISKLVMAFRAATITSNDLYGGIAAIAELRSIASETERDLMQASDDAEQLSR